MPATTHNKICNPDTLLIQVQEGVHRHTAAPLRLQPLLPLPLPDVDDKLKKGNHPTDEAYKNKSMPIHQYPLD
jgi:hypothetical protein